MDALGQNRPAINPLDSLFSTGFDFSGQSSISSRSVLLPEHTAGVDLMRGLLDQAAGGAKRLDYQANIFQRFIGPGLFSSVVDFNLLDQAVKAFDQDGKISF